MRVLIVEDEFLLAIDITDIVERLGHEVVGPAGSYRDALAVVGSAEIALVDVRLSDGYTGPDIAARIARDHNVTVVFMTGNPEAVFGSNDAAGVLTKPYLPEHIEEALQVAAACHAGREPPRTRFVTRLPITVQ